MTASFLLRTRWLLLVAISLLINLLQVPLLHGTFGALVVAVLTQVYLPGYLLARCLGRHRLPHPIHRFGWVLACGLSLTIVLGAPFRLFEQAIPVYLIALHIVMLIVALWRDGTAPPAEPTWHWSWGKLPLYGMVVVCCAIVMGVSYESRYRFYLFDDRPLFISYIDWLAHHPGERPVPETPLRSRQVSVISTDSRMDSDGWTYNHAAWSWTSGVTGSQIIWYDLATLFLWSVPLISFALAYELTRDEQTAAFSAAALTLVGLFTLDNLVYAPNYIAYGRWTVFQINVVRQASLTLMLPLALLCGFAYLRSAERRDIAPVALTTVALALMHPVQFMILAISLGAVGFAHWLGSPTRLALKKLAPLVLILVFTMGLPYLQRTIRIEGRTEEVLTVVRPDTITNPNSMANLYFKVLPELPLIGETYVRDPQAVFYHPAITFAVIIALLYGLRWRSGLARQYVFAVTLVALLLFFTPGLTRLFDRIVSSVGTLTAMFLLPVALSYGLAVRDGLHWFKSKWSHQFSERYALWIVSGGAIGVMLLLLLEPFPISASARDQLNAFNAIQEAQRMHPSQAAASALLVAGIPAGEISIVAAPQDMSGFVVEDSPDTVITGGRRDANRASAANNRFFSDGDSQSPWLDAGDVDFLKQWGVTHILALTDWTRLAQVHLQPERFEELGTVSGYVLYRIAIPLTVDETDRLFTRMNEHYAETTTHRWGRAGFNLAVPGLTEAWSPLIAEWQTLIRQNPLDERAHLGLAFAQTLAGEDAAALETWAQLYERYPDVPLYADALASTRAILNSPDVLAPLLTALESRNDYTRVLAARRLLTELFFYRLDDAVLAHVLTITEQDVVTWDRLANFDQPDAVRARSALLLYRGEWARAVKWLRAMPRVRLAPEDLTAMAAVALAQGDVEGALTILRPATDPDWVRPNAVVHPDRWVQNSAATLYQQIEQGRWYSELPTEPHPLDLRDAGSIYAFNPSVALSEDERTLQVTATFSDFRPRGAFPIQEWRVYVVSADGLTEYARVDTPAVFAGGPLTRTTIEVSLPELPVLTAAQVLIEPRHNNAVTVGPLRQTILLNRPPAAELPPAVTLEAIIFGDSIVLRGAAVQIEGDAIAVDLYWEANSVIRENYQIFIHVFDSAGNRVAQRDSGSVDNRYPTSEWRLDTLIADGHRLVLEQPLPPGDYTVWVGLYRLEDGVRLPVSGAEGRVLDDSLLIGSFSR
jgi:hypothetical protein